MSTELQQLNADHRVEFTIEPESIDGRIICEATEGAKCRLVCSVADCEAEQWPCFTYNDDGTETEHPMKDYGRCLVPDWFEDSIETYYNGPPQVLVNGPIVFDWQGDFYEWHYAAAELPSPAGTR
jgi:hypothetical protein